MLLRPAIAALRAAGHRVSLVAPLRAADALIGPDAVDGVLAADGPELARGLVEGLVDGPVARAVAGADAVVAYTRSAPLVACLRERARRLIVHDPAPPKRGLHAALWLWQPLGPLLAPAPKTPGNLAAVPPLAFEDHERRSADALARALPAGFLAVHPGSGSPAKNWPLERFAEAARRLAGTQPWLLVLGPAEQAFATPEGCVPARDWPLRVLGAALARAGLYLGNDSGVSHLAAAAGAPTLALFGPTDPRSWAPVGPRVRTLRAPGGSPARLAVEAVVRAGRRLRSAASGLPSG